MIFIILDNKMNDLSDHVLENNTKRMVDTLCISKHPPSPPLEILRKCGIFA